MTTNINNKVNSLRLINNNNPQLNSNKKTNFTNNGKTAENNDWLLCVKWLIDCDCLPQLLVDRFMTNDLTLGEFANSLRDGEILCNLANVLLPGSIDTTLINKRAHMSQMLCLKNIRLFLDACKSPLLFNLDESDLFDEHMLYEFDLARVIRALSILSNSKVCTESGIEGFSTISEQNQQTVTRTLSSSLNSSLSTSLSQTNLNSSDDIYYNIIPTETDQPDSYYTDASFLLGNHNLNDSQNDNGVYQIIVQQPQQSHHLPQKRDFVIREILNTEGNFINGLNTLMDDFLKPLSKILHDSDRKCICINIDSLIRLHESLYDELQKAVPGGPGMTGRICTVFESFKLPIMKEYAEYFSYIDRSLAKCDALTNSQSHSSSISATKTSNYANDFRAILEECRRKSKRGNFKLTDLLRLPYQRVLKYHLLFNELLKQTDVDHLAKDLILKTKESMCEVGNYLNECERDKENLTHSEKIMAHLTVDTKGNSNLNLKAYGHYIKDDKFRIKSIETGERIARTRTFFLFEIALIICKAKGDLYNYKETLLIEEYTIEDPSVTNSNSSHNSLNTSESNTNSLGISTSVVNIGLIGSSGANAHSLIMSNTARTKSYTFFFKNQEQKKVWKSCLLQAKQKVQPEGQRFNKHLFKLTNFDHDMVQCNACKKYLLGIFYQGYKCELCSFIAHKSCLFNTMSCCPPTPSPSILSVLLPPAKQPASSRLSQNSVHHHTPILIERSPSFKQQQSFIVKATYRYDGRPRPPEYPILTFNEGDLIQVTDDDDDEWWKGFLIKNNKTNAVLTTKEEGYFPSRHVKLFSGENYADAVIAGAPVIRNSMFILEEYSWFAPVDRTTADLILNRIQNIPSQTLFMVRCRQEGGYAISIKCNGLVEHIKINVNHLDSIPTSASNNSFNSLAMTLQNNLNISNDLGAGVTPSTTSAFYSIDQRNFSSVINLVKYYSQNTLKENFPQLETTLGLPYRDALPTPISIALAIHDYNPLTNPNNTGEQIELKRQMKYYIINKEPNGWWRVYNSDGLIGYAPGGYLQETVKI